MKQDKTSGRNLLLYALGILPVVWFALLTAPYFGQGLTGLMDGLTEAFVSPFRIELCPDSPKAVLLFLSAYALGLGIYLPDGSGCAFPQAAPPPGAAGSTCRTSGNTGAGKNTAPPNGDPRERSTGSMRTNPFSETGC